MKPSLLWDLCFKSLIFLSVHFWFHFLICLLDPGCFHFGERSSRDLPLFFPCCCNWIITRCLELPGSGTKFPPVFGPVSGLFFYWTLVYSWTSATALTYCGLYYVLLSCRFCPPSFLFFFRIFLIIIAQIFLNRISSSVFKPKFTYWLIQGESTLKLIVSLSFPKGYGFVRAFYIL